jgi:hypothetical protein
MIGMRSVRAAYTYLYSRIGVRTKVHERSIRSVLAQPMPRLMYITLAKAGSPHQTWNE